MKKQTKLVAVLSTAALLAIGASMTSFAATGWAEEDGTWVYYDRNGDKVTDKWAKSGSYWLGRRGWNLGLLQPRRGESNRGVEEIRRQLVLAG